MVLSSAIHLCGRLPLFAGLFWNAVISTGSQLEAILPRKKCRHDMVCCSLYAVCRAIEAAGAISSKGKGSRCCRNDSIPSRSTLAMSELCNRFSM